MENHRIIQVEDKVPLKLLIPLSIQHMFAMFGASVLVPFLFGINPAVVLFMNGVGTLLFIAVTNDDEANIMSAMLAKRMGAKKVMVLIQRRAYVDLVQGSVIDIAISPQQATISALLSHVRKADIVGVSSLRRGVAEAIEAVAHGDESTSRVVGRVIDEIKLPPGTIIGAVVRGNDVMIANDNLRIEQGDHVIMFLTDKKFITDVERLFQPSPFFL